MGTFKPPKIENIESTIDNQILYDPKSFVIVSVKKVFKKNNGKPMAWALILFDTEGQFVDDPSDIGIIMKAIPVSALSKFKVVNDKFKKRLEKLKEKQSYFVENNSYILAKNPEAKSRYYKNISDITNILALIKNKEINESVKSVFQPKTKYDIKNILKGKLIRDSEDDYLSLMTLQTVTKIYEILPEGALGTVIYSIYGKKGDKVLWEPQQYNSLSERIVDEKFISSMKHDIVIYKKRLNKKPQSINANKYYMLIDEYNNIIKEYEKGIVNESFPVDLYKKNLNESTKSIFKPKTVDQKKESLVNYLWDLRKKYAPGPPKGKRDEYIKIIDILYDYDYDLIRINDDKLWFIQLGKPYDNKSIMINPWTESNDIYLRLVNESVETVFKPIDNKEKAKRILDYAYQIYITMQHNDKMSIEYFKEIFKTLYENGFEFNRNDNLGVLWFAKDISYDNSWIAINGFTTLEYVKEQMEKINGISKLESI